jgi:hypothetical protein
MIVDNRHISIPDFLRTDITGLVDFESSRAALTEIADSCSRSGVRHVLIDVRMARALNLGVPDIFTLVMYMMTLGFDRGYQIALLYEPQDEIERSKLFAECANLQGMNVASFQDFEQAIEWLEGNSLKPNQ